VELAKIYMFSPPRANDGNIVMLRHLWGKCSQLLCGKKKLFKILHKCIRMAHLRKKRNRATMWHSEGLWRYNCVKKNICSGPTSITFLVFSKVSHILIVNSIDKALRYFLNFPLVFLKASLYCVQTVSPSQYTLLLFY